MTPVLSLVVPVFDERDNLGVLVAEVEAALADLGCPWEMIAVDDGSRDGSLDRLLELGRERCWLRVLTLGGHRGQSAALLAGFRAARGETVVTLDADLQNDPADIPLLLAALAGHDVVSGVRHERRDRWLRRISSRLANGLRRRVLDDGIHDVGCSLKAYRREVLAEVPAFDGMHRFLPALVRLRGARVCEIEVRHRPRLRGRSKYGVRNRLGRGIVDLCGVAWLRRRWLRLDGARELRADVAGQNR